MRTEVVERGDGETDDDDGTDVQLKVRQLMVDQLTEHGGLGALFQNCCNWLRLRLAAILLALGIICEGFILANINSNISIR